MQDIKAVLDIGSGWIKTIVIGEEDGKRTTLHKSLMLTKGIRKGNIINAEDLTNSIENVINDIHKKLGGEYIDEYIISISHPQMKHRRIREQKRILKERVSNDDVKHLSAIVSDMSKDTHQELIKIVPIYRIIDDQEKVKDPLGIEANKLDIVADIFYLPVSFYNTLVDIVESIDMYVIDIIPNYLATAEASLDYDTKDLGCISIDIGKEQTSFIIYENGYPLWYETIAIGGDAVTRDISIGMQLDIKEAEDIKIKEGGVGLLEKNQEESSIDKHFLYQIITARYEEILEKIHARLEELQKDGRLAGGVIFSGGGAKVRNLAPLAKDIFQLAVFAAEDVHTVSKEVKTNMQFINVTGAYSRSSLYTDNKKGLGIDLRAGREVIKKVGDFFKKLF